MKKVLKTALIFLCVSLVILSFSSCGKSTKDEIIGNWECETSDNWMWLRVSKDGTSSLFIMDMNTAKTSMEEGTWTLDGNILTCDIDSIKLEFTYENGTLIMEQVLTFTKMAQKPNVG